MIPTQTRNLIDRIRRSCVLEDDTKIGVRACFGAGVRLQSKENTHDVIGMATTDEVDQEGDVVLPGGADTKYIGRNRKVFVDHWTEMGSLVGTIRSMKLIEGTPSGWQVRVALQRGGAYTDLIAELASTVGIGFSIGFVPLEWGAPTPEEAKKYPGATNIIRRWEWYELSFTPFPCNVSCQTSGTAKVGGERAERMLKTLRKKATPEARRMLRMRTLVVPGPLVLELEPSEN